MTKVKLLIGDNKLYGFEISGHSDYADEGSDIVCSAISSASLMAANTITEVIGDRAEASMDDGYLSFRLIDGSKASYQVLEGLKLHLTEISEQYPKNIRIIYGGVQNA